MDNKQEQISDSVFRKIQLLLNLASRSEGNEAEAAAAMSKAQELLAAYNLDLATVQDKVVAGGTVAKSVKREHVVSKRNATYAWSQRLVKAIAEANYCRYWAADVLNEKTHKFIKRHRVLGRMENTTAVLIMSDYLYETIMRLLPYDKSSWLSADAMLWCDGCVDRLVERITAKAESMRTADYATQGEKAYTTAMSIRTMAEKEEQGNYDAINGEGAWARKLARDAQWEADWKAGAAERAARRRLEAEEAAAKLLAETPEQKEARLAREARERVREAKRSENYWKKEDARAEREALKKNSSAYRAGKRTAESIGLNDQLKTTTNKSLR